MSSILLCATLIYGISSDRPLSYKQAHDQAIASKRPILVLVGADWCPACRVMKQVTMPAMQRDGKLNDVLYAVVDVDDESKLASRLMQSSSVPQLVLYTPGTQGWYRMGLEGAQQPERIAALIQQGLDLQRRRGSVLGKRGNAKRQDAISDPSDSVADE